jgi:hypothetical protein
MTDAPQFPPGWYADPDNPTVHRWWNGSAWTDARQPAPGAAQAPAAPAAPATAYPAYPSAQTAYPAYPSGAATTSVERRDIPTETPWIWLIVFLPLLSFLPMLFIDWRGFLEDSIEDSLESPSSAWAAGLTGGMLLWTLFTYLIIAAQVVFAYLDWRALRARGIDKPFHWAWIFFTLLISNGVYVIGRGVILRRQTGKGLAPVWAWIAVTVLSIVVGAVFATYLLNEVFHLINTYENFSRP